MKKSVLFLGMGAMLLASCSGNQKKIDEDSIRIADLTAEYQEAATFNDSLMLLMGDIYTGLDSINMQEGLLYNMGNSENGDRRAEIRQNLASIKARLATLQNQDIGQREQRNVKDNQAAQGAYRFAG